LWRIGDPYRSHLIAPEISTVRLPRGLVFTNACVARCKLDISSVTAVAWHLAPAEFATKPCLVDLVRQHQMRFAAIASEPISRD